ncbi:hypothetical protein BJX99DRAFT_255929 [Aspergillus californicus]
MTISTEAIVGIVAVLLASIPVGVSAANVWRQRKIQGQDNAYSQTPLLPIWRPELGGNVHFLDEAVESYYEQRQFT